MRKLMAMLLALLMVMSMAACGSGEDGIAEIPTTEDGVSAFESATGQMNFTLSKIPYDMTFGDKTVQLSRVVFYEEYSDHGYYPYIVVTLNRENLTDDDIYWMTKYDDKKHGKEIDINVYARSGKNELDSDVLSYIGAIYDSRNLYFIYYGEKARYSYMGSEFSCQIIHAPSGLIKDDTVYYYYSLLINESNYSDSDDVLTDAERSAMNQAIESYLNRYK